MKKGIFLLGIIAICLLGCEKNFVEQKGFEGEWYYTKAERVRVFSQNENLLPDYQDIYITFNANNSFEYKSDNGTWTGFVKKEDYEGGTDLILDFDDNTQEIWSEFSHNKNKRIIRYNYYDDNDTYRFELEKNVTQIRRR